MTKIRKVKRQKKFRYNVNKRRERNKRRKGPTIECKEVKKAWSDVKSVERNLGEMGLVYDVNKTFKIPTTKELLHPELKKRDEDVMETDAPVKNFVAEQLETDAKAPRVRHLRLPKNQVQWLSYLIEKYGEDYKAMARDKKNYEQATWKQLRGQIKTFKGIPEQYEKFLETIAENSDSNKV